MAEDKQQTTLIGRLAERLGVEPGKLMGALRRVSGNIRGVEDEDFMVMLLVAEKYGLDPIRREVGLISTQQGPRPYVAFDGWLKVLTSHDDYLTHDVAEVVSEGRVVAATVSIRSKKREALQAGPFHHTEWMDECYVPPRNRSDGSGKVNGPWQSHPRRMLKEKAIMQGARFLWNLYVPTEDEWQRMDDVQGAGDMVVAAKTDAPAMRPAVSLPAPVTQEQIAAARPMDAEAVVVAAEFVGAPPLAQAEDRASRRKPRQAAPKPTLPAYDPEESRRIDKELAAQQAREQEGQSDDFFAGL